MKKYISKTLLLTVLTVALSGWSFGQNTTGQGLMDPFHQVRITIDIPNTIPAGTVVTIKAEWDVEASVMTPPDEGASFTVVENKFQYVIVLYCPIDAGPHAIHLCIKTDQAFLQRLYTSADEPINQSSSTTYVDIAASSWTSTNGCKLSGSNVHDD